MVAGLVTVPVIHEYFSNRSRERKLASAFDKGTVPKPPFEVLIQRKGMLKKISRILQPPAGYPGCDMIIGYDGAGKTTLVQQVGHEHSGIIYVDISPFGTSNKGFGYTFAQALHWSPPLSPSWFKVLLGTPDLIRDEIFGTLLL